MAIVRCSRGHYYDNEKFSQCPHCGINFVDEEEKTRPLQETERGGEDEDKTVSMETLSSEKSTGVEDDDKTISLYAKEKGVDFIVGWLVCVKGPERGRDWRLHQGFNRVGRGYDLDVNVADDLYMGREAECAIVYDDRANQFFAVQQGAGTAYLNGALLAGAVPIQTGDILRAGSSELEFVAFCREGRTWEKE